MKHTPTPYRKGNFTEFGIDSKDGPVAKVLDWKNAEETREFIITACNSHDDLLEACKYAREQLRNVKGKTFPILPIL